MTGACDELLGRVERLEARLERVESVQSIERLGQRYALAADARDIENLLLLFVDDVDCGRFGVGRDVLRSSYEVVHRQFYRTVHQVVGHTIAFVDADHATGTVLMRAEHEVADRWIVAMLCMFDTYERRGGEWFFVRRKPESWYVTDYGVPPHGPDWSPEGWDGRTPRLPHLFPTWATFWDGNAARAAELTDFPV